MLSIGELVSSCESEHFAHTNVDVAHFRTRNGVDEYHLMIRPLGCADLTTQTSWVKKAYQGVCTSLGLDIETGVFRRIFCSDLINQAPLLKNALGDLEESCAVSWVSQPPAPPARIALWAYHVRVPGGPLDTCKKGATLSLRRGELTHCWTTGLTCPEGETSYAQTSGILTQYEDELQARDMCLADHVQRTWFYVRDIDANYRGLVAARREFFTVRGLTPETHYIASTGIEGEAANATASVLLDAYAIAGVRPEQIRYLSAPDHLCPTHLYGVTFERGVSIAYRDRTHTFISGTASIDRAGNILHPGDVRKQLDRTLENVTALLHQANATLDDVRVFLIYVRDPADLALVQQIMAERHPDTPAQTLLAPVCRPGWLIEIECIAITPAENPGFPEF